MASRTVKRSIAILLVLAALLAVGLVVRARSHAAATARLPDVPDLSGRPAALAAHLREADRAARRRPAAAEQVGALGMAYHADLFYAPAAQAYRLARELDPGDWRWSYYLALLHLERGEARPAEENLQDVVAARPDFALAWWRLGEAAFKRGSYDRADEAYSRAAAVPATEAAIYASTGRARVALQQGRVEAARQILERLVSTEPRFGTAHRLLGDIYRSQGRASDAERQLARAGSLRAYAAPRDEMVDALADQSRSSVFLLKLAGATDLRRGAPRREVLTRRALEFDPHNPDVVYETGALLQQLRRPAEALTYFVQHLDMATDDQQTLVQIGKCYSDLGRLAEAEKALREALAISNDAVGLYNLGYVMEQQGRAADADAQYRRAIAVNPNMASARNNLGSLLARRGRLAEAVAHLTEAARLDPANADIYTNLSAVALRGGSVAEASRYARLALEIDPRHADAHANLGIALAQQGAFEEAVREFDEALRLDPHHSAARSNRDAVLARMRRGSSATTAQ